MNRNENARVLITGASSGIGREMARVFARNGHSLIISARREERLKELANEITAEFNLPVESLTADLSTSEGVEALAGEIDNRKYSVETLVNNAGINVYGPFSDSDRNELLAMARLNMLALIDLTHRLLPAMIEAGGGGVLNVASTGGFAPSPYSAVYCASKAFVLNFSEALAHELKGTGVRVTAVCPGATHSEFAERAGMEATRLFKGPVLDARTVAETGYRALQHGRSKVVVGAFNKTLISSLRLVPRGVGTRIAAWLLSSKTEH